MSVENLDDNESLKTENDFLRMKLMLERGAYFGGENKELPADIENQFLNNVMAFEKQFDERKRIKLFDRIGRPQHFKPVGDISDNEIEEAYKSLLDYLNEHSIDFSVCSPNIKVRELYRFVTEELFDHEMDDMNLPGWTTNFIYDEFYPDAVYDNTRDAEDCIRFILKKESVEFMYHCRCKNLQLNGHHSLTEDKCIEVVNRFKLAYDGLEINEINVLECIVDGKESCVSGNYSITATSANENQQLTGNWKLIFERDEDFGYWYINNIQIDGIDF
jgi:hypothetical protein